MPELNSCYAFLGNLYERSCNGSYASLCLSQSVAYETEVKHVAGLITACNVRR